MEIHPDWKEFIGLLNAHGVDYVVIGAHALAFHAIPRATADIDFLIDRRQENADRLRKALQAFGFTLSDEESAKLQIPDQILQLGVAPYRIDVFTSIHGVNNSDVFLRRVRGSLGGIDPVWFISREDLIAAKRGAGRAKDLADLETLED
ncbi:MAG: nucleotidyl transferase AbiEii/AbiGii toxin family protein [Fimbriimonadaceae bacterium]